MAFFRAHFGACTTLGVAARVALTNDAQLAAQVATNGSPEAVNAARGAAPRHVCVTMAWHTHEISVLWGRDSSLRGGAATLALGLRGMRLFDVKIIVNPQGVASFFLVWFGLAFGGKLRHRVEHSLRHRLQIFTSSCCTRNVTSLWRFMGFRLRRPSSVATRHCRHFHSHDRCSIDSFFLIRFSFIFFRTILFA